MNDSSAVSPDLSLGNLGLDSLMVVEIRQKLERDYDIFMSAEDVRALTFAKLDQLSARDTARDTAATASKAVGIKQLIPAAPIRFELQQLCPTEAVTEMNQVDTEAAPLFVIHGASGFVVHLSSVMSKICSAKVYGIQCAGDAPLTSIPELAKHHIKVPVHFFNFYRENWISFQRISALRCYFRNML